MMTMSGFRIKRKGTDCGGFTLLEVLVALSIIAIVLVAALRLQGQSVTMNETARFYAAAPFLAQQKMAEVRFDPQRFMGSESGRFEQSSPPDLDWQVALEPVEISSPEDTLLQMYFARVTIHSGTLKINYVLRDYIHAVTGDRHR